MPLMDHAITGVYIMLHMHTHPCIFVGVISKNSPDILCLLVLQCWLMSNSPAPIQ